MQPVTGTGRASRAFAWGVRQLGDQSRGGHRQNRPVLGRMGTGFHVLTSGVSAFGGVWVCHRRHVGCDFGGLLFGLALTLLRGVFRCCFVWNSSARCVTAVGRCLLRLVSSKVGFRLITSVFDLCVSLFWLRQHRCQWGGLMRRSISCFVISLGRVACALHCRRSFVGIIRSFVIVVSSTFAPLLGMSPIVPLVQKYGEARTRPTEIHRRLSMSSPWNNRYGPMSGSQPIQIAPLSHFLPANTSGLPWPHHDRWPG